MKNVEDLIIIGSGPAGLTAGIYAGRSNLKTLIFTGANIGGQLMSTTKIENFPGFVDGIEGPILMQNMLAQAKVFGAKIEYKNVTEVDLSSSPKKIFAEETQYFAKSVIIATGSSPRLLGLDSEKKYWAKGVSSCATCDGAFYKEKIVAVIGGGDSAMEEATFLTRFASKVFIIHRRHEFKASDIMQKRVFENPKIEIIWDSEVLEILGNGEKVTGISIRNNQNNKKLELSLDGVFLGIGHIPNIDFLKNQVELDEQGFIKPIDNTKTNINGVFVAGDVRDHKYQQAITASGFGCMAFLDAQKWLEVNK